MAWHDSIEEAVRTATTAAADAVVTIGRGSGLVVADGRVATNAHNLPGEQVHVHFADGRTETGEVAGADLDGDLAVVTVDTADVAPVARTEEPVRLGQPIIALARPRHRGLVVTVGTIAAVDARFRGPRGRLVAGAFEHDARLPRGASGGPVVDVDGRLVGIDTHRRRDGFYVAVPADASLGGRLDGLAEGVVAPRARLGVAVAPPHVARRMRAAVGLPDREGILVREVDPDGPAATAGMATGDLVVAVDGAPVVSIDDLHAAMAAATDTLELTIVRGTEERTVTVNVLAASA